MFVLKRIEDGQYVAHPGNRSSYTGKLEDARVFRTREAAEKDRCSNERIVDLNHIFR